jgi:hypothetical protein
LDCTGDADFIAALRQNDIIEAGASRLVANQSSS